MKLPFTKKPVKMPVFERPDYADGAVLSSSLAVFDTFKGYAKADREFFVVCYLDPKNRAIEVIEANEGTVDSSAVYPREIIKGAIILGAVSIVCFHNHPSGDPEPSLCDREITKEISFACRVMGIRFLDHVILGNSGYFSFADKGLIEDYNLTFLSLAK
ncbi:MAG: JAB domain-containing protein [bacterium]|nr:JAB domain-containing protein [bacterium]